MEGVLRARLIVDRPGFRLDLELDAEQGTVVALLGPNGAGKSTSLRALAGLQPLTDGEVRLGDEVLESVPGRSRIAPDQRPVGMVFQDYLLFPHLSILENVAFGPRAHGISKQAARSVARDWLKRVDLDDLEHSKPGQLSGGQAQRAALARALAVRPALLLLDEPLAALDASVRPSVRSVLGKHLSAYDGIGLLVTHDPLDAMILADRIVVLEDGKATQEGKPAEIAMAPRTDYAADLFGLNFYRGTGHDSIVRIDSGGELSTATPTEGPVCVAFSPASVALFPNRPDGSPRNSWRVTVDSMERHGSVVRIKLRGQLDVLADVTSGAVAELGLAPGKQLWAAVKATEIAVYPA